MKNLPCGTNPSFLNLHPQFFILNSSFYTIMIEINNLSKVFRTSEVETVALNQVNLQVEEGEFVAIMGPSGCGKSTLLNILGLLDNPTSGSYKLLGQEVADLHEKDRTRVRKGKIGFVFQSFNLIDELNVFENVELPLTYLGIKAAERKEMVNNILRRMNIGHRAKHFPQQLSGGQQQRVAIARAVVTNPKLILADEPTGNHDHRHGDALAARRLLRLPHGAPVRRERGGEHEEQPVNGKTDVSVMLSIVLPRQTGEVRGGAKRSRNISFLLCKPVVRFFDYALTGSAQNDRYITRWRNYDQICTLSVNPLCGFAGRYLRFCPKISPSLSADISALARRYPRL